MKKIALMPEYECDGIWSYILYEALDKDDTDKYSTYEALHLDDFPISDKVKKAVSRWNKIFDFQDYKIKWSGRKEKQFNKRGHKAAQMLANELAGKFEIVYLEYSKSNELICIEFKENI